MQRLVELEHHVVRDVNDGVDGPHAGRCQPGLHDYGRPPHPRQPEEPGTVTRTQLGVIDAHCHTFSCCLGGVEKASGMRSAVPVTAATSRATPTMQAIGAVRGNLKLQHGVGEGNGRTSSPGSMPVEVGMPSAWARSSSFAEQSMLGSHASELHFADVLAVPAPAGQDQRKYVVHGHIHGGGDHLCQWAILADVELRHAQRARGGVRVDVRNSACDYVLELIAGGNHSLDLRAGHREPVGEGRGVHVYVNVVS